MLKPFVRDGNLNEFCHLRIVGYCVYTWSVFITFIKIAGFMILNGNNQKREHSCAKENFIEHETTENKTNSVWLTTDLPVHLVKLVKARISHLNDERELRLGFLAPLLPLGTVLSVKFL